MQKLTRSKAIKKLDAVFSEYIRLRDSDENGIVTCPLCWTRIKRKNAQNMHFITRGCYLYRYDEINCHAWCMRCNVFLNGNYIVYTRRMQKTFGIEKVDEMIKNKATVFKISTPRLLEMIDEYGEKVNKLKSLYIKE